MTRLTEKMIVQIISMSIYSPSSSGEVGIPDSDLDSLPASDIKGSESAKVGSMDWSSSRNPGTLSGDGAWVRYTNSAPYADVVGISQSNCTMILISTWEVSNFMAESLISEDLELNPDDMDDSYEIAVDSATPRLYLGSLFSSPESL